MEVAMALKSTVSRFISWRVSRESVSKSSMSCDMRCAAARMRPGNFALVIELVGVVFHQDLAKAVDASQRRPQIVRDGVAEGLQLLVGRVEKFHGSRQVFIELSRLFLGELSLGDVGRDAADFLGRPSGP